MIEEEGERMRKRMRESVRETKRERDNARDEILFGFRERAELRLLRIGYLIPVLELVT